MQKVFCQGCVLGSGVAYKSSCLWKVPIKRVLTHPVGSWFLSTQVCTGTGRSRGHMTLRCGSHMIDCSWYQIYPLDKLQHKHIYETK